jgi:hypothetical protein
VVLGVAMGIARESVDADLGGRHGRLRHAAP